MQLTIDHVDVAIDGSRIVSGVDLVCGPGEVTALVGPNGSGKSTILRAVYRHLRPTAGAVRLGDEDIWALRPDTAARRIAALPQERPAEFELTVAEVVGMGRIPHRRGFGRGSDEDRHRVGAALDQVGLAAHADRSFATLSGGERQRALLARAVAQDPQVLVLDEPTNHLDIQHQIELLRLLRSVGRTTLVAIHDLNTAAAIADRVHVVRAGQVVASGPPATVITAELLREVFGVRSEVMTNPLTGRLLVAYDDRPDTVAAGSPLPGSAGAAGGSAGRTGPRPPGPRAAPR